MISPALFWVIAFVTVIPALALLFARKPVHVAMAVVSTMIGLAAAYVALSAPFLGVVQIVVYTGAVMMLFLFVLMLIGVDQRENLKETLTGQRWIGLTLSAGIAIMMIATLSDVHIGVQRAKVGDPQVIADALFTKYVLVIEALGFLLITAAVGALLLTHVPRLRPRRTQKELQAERIALKANPVNRPMPGVYARHNALDAPALGPDGEAIEDSVSRVLEVRHQTREGGDFRDQNRQTRRELGASKGEEDSE